MPKTLTEAEIDQILADVEQTLNASVLSKSEKTPKKLAKADEDRPEDDRPAAEAPAPESSALAEDAPAAPPAEGAPTEEAPAAPPAEEAPAEGAPAEETPAEGSEEELEEPQLSDEELHQIYGSMSPEELERHYMVIRQYMQEAYAKMEKSEKDSKEAGSSKDSEAIESLKKDNASLKDKVGELQKSLEVAVKALEIGLKPVRKSVAGIEYVKKSEADSPVVKPLEKSELQAKVGEFYQDKAKVSALKKSERDAIDNFLLNGSDKEKVEQILNIGGK